MNAPAPLRQTVVAHEREHIAAYDALAIVVAQLIVILLPWNLPLWWFAKRLRATIEVDCDARVLQRGFDPEHYADILLAVAERRMRSPHAAAALIEPVTQLERRIRIMLTQRTRSVGRAVAAVAVTVALTACATQMDAPVLLTDSRPRASAGAAPSILVQRGPARIIMNEPAAGP